MPLKAAIVSVTPFAQNCTLLWDEASKLGAVVDPGGDVRRIEAGIAQAGISVEKIVLTHGHIDHAGGAMELKEKLGGVPIDLSKVRTPAYFISTAEDHIAPWKSTYLCARALGGPVRFVCGGSGHIAGIVNPPAAKKYCYWTNDTTPEAPESWLAGATQHDGSWWPDWVEWVKAHSDGEAAARQPGDGKLKPIEDAPGSYVKLRV